MMRSLLIILCANPVLTLAQPWGGTYSGQLNGMPAVLELKSEATQVTGTIDASGYTYQLSCKAEGSNCHGTFSDPATGGTLPMLMKIDNSSVMLNITFTDDFGNQQVMNFQFTREHPSGKAGSNKPVANVTLDQAMVGNWLYSDSYVSGDFSMTTQYRLIVKADGTYLYGDGKVAGGGDAGSVSSGGGGYQQGKWKTENRIVYIDEGQGWQPYAKYYIEGNSMMFTFENGKKQLWKRY